MCHGITAPTILPYIMSAWHIKHLPWKCDLTCSDDCTDRRRTHNPSKNTLLLILLQLLQHMFPSDARSTMAPSLFTRCGTLHTPCHNKSPFYGCAMDYVHSPTSDLQRLHQRLQRPNLNIIIQPLSSTKKIDLFSFFKNCDRLL